MLVAIDFLTFVFTSFFEHDFGVSTLGGLVASLLLPLCGYSGVRNKDQQLLGCFWSWSLVFFAFHMITVALFLMLLFRGYGWVLIIPTMGNLLGALLLYLAFYWGKRLQEKPYWLQDDESMVDASTVDVDASPVPEAVILEDPTAMKRALERKYSSQLGVQLSREVPAELEEGQCDDEVFHDVENPDEDDEDETEPELTTNRMRSDGPENVLLL